MPQPSEREIEVFNVALGLSAGERVAYLDRACANDALLRQRIKELLQSSEESCACLEVPEAVSPGSVATTRPALIPTEKPGDRIGRYKVLQQIGEGGCGVVYMAEQQEPVHRRVALKVIKLGMDTKQVIARFEAERQALALMDHPNIAKVLDAGATETGRPYFVMELVRGIKITDYCDQNNLSTRERLDLFIQVCRAIQHAHQKGIIHRDIKPSNILVTMDDRVPVPKVIDFGIAKATQGKLTDRTLFTAFEQFIGTPAYMSPEQAEMRVQDIDTRSDIYSLGVLLYELLTGQTPFDAKRLLEAGLDEIRRTIRESEPARPSTRLSTMLAGELTVTANHRRVQPPKLIHLVRGDLDWIVMKCLEKDRTRRYDTVNGVAMDITRHLNCEAVLARAPSNHYRLQKLVRRNKQTFFWMALVALLLVLGITGSTWLAVRATRAEREQRWLRQQAEAGRAAETALLQATETREKIARATVLFDNAHYDQSESMLKKIPVSGLAEPERAALLRTLGTRRVELDQWKDAVDDFSAVLRFNAADDADTIGLDLLRFGPVLIRSGGITKYRQFGRETIARFAGTSDPTMAERVCRVCLLMPADEETLKGLSAFYTLASNKTNGFPNADAERWACTSLALFDYRRGNYAKAAEWTSITLTGNFETYLAIAHVIRAMSLQKLGQGAAGQDDFFKGRAAINEASAKETIIESQGFDSFDWLYGRILLREAEALAINEKIWLNHPGKLDVLGYRFDRDEVVFVFEPAAFGVQVAANSQVCVAGDFNQWLGASDGKIKSIVPAWQMQQVASNRYELRKKLVDFIQWPQWEFKFVVNLNQWMDPPTKTLNLTGGNPANLTLTLPENTYQPEP
jgi:serine/threonine protein kinase